MTIGNTNHILEMAIENTKRMNKINIKPLSVNQAWQGKRFKTPAYKSYESQTLLLLPKDIEVSTGALRLTITAGLSSKLADVDNIAKPFIDILQKKYNFNDNQIFHLSMIKEIVKKGDEFVAFQFEAME